MALQRMVRHLEVVPELVESSHTDLRRTHLSEVMYEFSVSEIATEIRLQC